MHEGLLYCAAWSVCCSINIKNPSGLQKKIISVFLGWFLTFFIVLVSKGTRILGWPTSLILGPVFNLNALVWHIDAIFFRPPNLSLKSDSQMLLYQRKTVVKNNCYSSKYTKRPDWKNLSIQNKSFLSLNKSNLQLLEKQSSSLLAIGVEKFSALPSKTKVANEKKLVQSGKFETFKDIKFFIMNVQVLQSSLLL